MLFFSLIQFILFSGVFYFLITQIVVPILTGTVMFPWVKNQRKQRALQERTKILTAIEAHELELQNEKLNRKLKEKENAK